MPLNARKAARVVANRVLIRAGRTTSVAAVYCTAYGGRTARAVEVVLKQQATSAPQVVDVEGGATAPEYLAEWPIEIDPRPVAFVALTGGALDDAAIDAAIQLEIVTYRQAGLAPDRWYVALRRLR